MHPQIRRADGAPPGLCILCHAQEGVKLSHHIKMAVGAKLSSQTQFISREVSSKLYTARYAKLRKVHLPGDVLHAEGWAGRYSSAETGILT